MIHAIEPLTSALKHARTHHKLSQRDLSQKTGLPQAQISRIENAGVDLKTSTLIELARALDLEVMLIPRKYLPAVTYLTQSAADSENAAARPAYTLDGAADDD